MYSIGLSMQLKPGSYEGYKEAHDNLWPEIAKSMDDNNVSMSIYLLGEPSVLARGRTVRGRLAQESRSILHWNGGRSIWETTSQRMMRATSSLTHCRRRSHLVCSNRNRDLTDLSQYRFTPFRHDLFLPRL